MAILDKNTSPQILLQKQYRPALDKITVEIPGGLIDPGESIEQCALRELKEETGYVGEVERTSGILFNCMSLLNLRVCLSWPKLITDELIAPGFSNNNFNLVYVNVDTSLPENQNPAPQLEEDELIESFTLPVSSLFSEIKKLQDEGYAIETRVVAIAEGLEMARKWKV